MGEGASRKLEKVSLLEYSLKAFKPLKWACMSTPVLAFADYTKKFLLETNASKEGLGAVLSFHQTGVPSTKMGGHRTFQGILAIPTLFGEN